MKKVRNGFIKNFRYLCLIGVIALGLMTIVGTGGGGGGGDSGGGGGGDGDDDQLTTGLVLGKVRNGETSEFISGAVVSAGGISDTTDAVGTYWLEGVPEGNQTLTATATGYADYSHSIECVGGASNSYNIELVPFHTVSVSVTKDTYVDQYSPQSNHGDSVLIITTYAENVRKDALLYAPISNYIPAGAEIIKVEFVGYSSDAVWDFFVAPIESSWDEHSITWATRPAQGIGLPVYDASKNGTEYRIDVSYPFTSSTYASYAIEYGICIMPFKNEIFPDWNGIWFYSSEHSTPSYHPWFEVTYIQ